MSRRKSVNFIRDVGVDPRFNSPTVQKLINVVMWRGKKNTARTIVYEAFDILGKKAHGDETKALELFNRALEQITPVVEVKPRRVGGSVYQIPTEVSEHRGRSLALRWLIAAASQRSDERMGIRLAHEILAAVEGQGAAVKKNLDVRKMAEANRAYSHYGW